MGTGLGALATEGEWAYSARWQALLARRPSTSGSARSHRGRIIESRAADLALPCPAPRGLQSAPLQRLAGERFAHGVAVSCPGEADVHLYGLAYDSAGVATVTARTTYAALDADRDVQLYTVQVLPDGRTYFVGADDDPQGLFVIAVDAAGMSLPFLAGATPQVGALDHQGGVIWWTRRCPLVELHRCRR